jgi:hypothetical protein
VAARLNPPPVSFFDEGKMSRVSPALAYHAISDGVSRTAMPAFSVLSAADRWSLAYLVVAMRHTPVDDTRGKTLYARSWARMSPIAEAIAQLSDAELDAMLGKITDARERRETIDWLRTTATFREPWDRTFPGARRLLAEVADSAGDRDKALRLTLTAYMTEVEPHEKLLVVLDRAANRRIEQGFAELRGAIMSGKSEAEIRAEVARLDQILRDPSATPSVVSPVSPPAAPASGLRKGHLLLLALLPIAAILVFLRKRFHLVRWVCSSGTFLRGTARLRSERSQLRPRAHRG